jgi:histidyl-tRNA synthetase
MKIERCKGMRDLFPHEMEKFRIITDIFRDSCKKWGYEEVKTPTLESLYLFTSAGTLTPGMLSKVYSFLDWDGWSGERVVLRPEATIPVARLYAESLSDRELAKLFYIVNTFIFEETGKKDREKWQLGAELIGMGSPLADVELIMLAMEVLNRLGLSRTELKLSHTGLTRGIVQQLGLSPEQENQVFDQLLDGDVATLNRIKIEKPELAPLFELQGKSSGFVKNLASYFTGDLTELQPLIDNFVFIADTLQQLGCPYQIDIASVRGFEYYTGVIFQLLINEEKVGGGGRYDALIPATEGKATPASGFALYMDPLMNLVKSEQINPMTTPKIMVKVDEDAAGLGFAVAELLRNTGYIVKLHLGGKGPTDTLWKLEVHGKPPLFVLTDLPRNKHYELQSSEDVLERLERQ